VNAAPNAAPVAQNDTYSTDEDDPLTVAAPGVLANDNDPEGGPLTAVNASDPANGAVLLSENGSFIYTPDPNFFGTDGFTYSARDAAGNTTAATVTINVAAVNDAPSFTGGPDDSWPANAPEPASVFAWAKGITSGPDNENTQTLEFLVTADDSNLFFAQPSISTVDGTLTYRGNGTQGSTVVRVRLKDSGGGTDTSAEYTFTITLT
jgi:hypothetical protein